MKTLFFLILTLSLQSLCFADETPKRIMLPQTPVLEQPDDVSPKTISELASGEFYVIESEVELVILHSPDGFVGKVSSKGPVTTIGRFSDGNGKVEVRTFSSPYVYMLSALSPGKVEIIVIPVGASAEADIIRQPLTLMGQAPNPPPTPPIPPSPPDPIDPDPPVPVPVSSFRVIFVKESGDTLNASQSAIPGAKAIRDYLTAKTTPEGGFAGWREYDPDQTTANEQPTMRALWEAVKPKLLPAPCMVIEVNGNATVMPFPKDATEALETLKKAGGS